MRQHACLHQQRIHFVIERIQAGQHVALEQFQDDQTNLDIHVHLAQRGAEGMRQRGRTERIVAVVDAVAAADHRQPLVQRVQCAGETAIGLGHHARDRQRFFQFAVVHQRQLSAARGRGGRVGTFRARARAAHREFAETARDFLAEQPLQQRTLLARLAHAVEILRLRGVAFGLLGEIEQRVVDVVEQVGREFVAAFQCQRAHRAEQFTDTVIARIATAGQFHHLARF